MLKWFSSLLLFNFMFISFSCTTTSSFYSISAEDFEHNFNRYRTYAWIPYDYLFCQKTSATIYQGICNNPVYERMLRDEVNDYLFGAGLIVNSHNPDLLITYKIVFKDITINEIIAYNKENFSGQGYPPGDPNILTPYNKLTGNYTIYSDNYIYEPGGNIFLPDPDNIPYSSNYFSEVNYVFETLLREGTIVIEVIDRKSNYTVWTGWSKEVINGPVDFRLKLEPIIHQIMKRFPGLNY